MIRLGVLVPGDRLAAWQRRALVHLIDGGDVELVLVVVDASARRRPARRTLHPQVHRLSHSLWRLYNNGWVARRAHSIRRVDCGDLLADASRIEVTPERVGRFSQHFSADALESIGEARPDVLLRFGFGILRGDVLDAATHGVWSFHHDDEREIRGGPPSFWEVADGSPTTGVVLQRLTERLDGGIVLGRATFGTVRHSYPRNRDRAAFGASMLPARTARAVRFGRISTDAAPTETTARIRRNPSNGEFIAFAFRQAWRAVRIRLGAIARADRWRIGLAASAGAMPSSGPFEWLPTRAGGYFADPFPTVRDGRAGVLVEEFDERRGVGTISSITRPSAAASGEWVVDHRVIDTGGHASYPFLVDVGGELHCVPETARGGTVSAWRCIRFPDRWTHAGELLGLPVLDPTVVEWSGRWWLFGTRRDGDPNAELWLWSSKAFLGPWMSHPQNPVKIDVRNARPGGSPFVSCGRLYRPAQDCSRTYGGGIVLNEVTRLDAEGFDEHVVERWLPGDPGRVSGVHTVGVDHGLVAIDVNRRVVDRHHVRREIAARLGRLR